MTRPAARAAAVAAALVLLSVPAGLVAQDWPAERPPAPLAAHGVAFPPYSISTLSNGLRVLFVPWHEQPSVSFRLIVRAGAVEEPADRPGVASFVASLLDQGAGVRSASEIATLIDSAGGFIGVGSGNEITFVNAAVIKDRAEQALGLIADVAEHPTFPASEIQLRRDQALSSLQVSYDDPDYLASLVFERLVYGGHAYGRPNDGTPRSIARITRDDLVAFHRTWFVPNNALLAIVGDLTADEAGAMAERALGGWVKRETPPVTAGALPPPAPRLVIVDRPGSAQTEIRVGHVAMARTHPDFLPFDMAIRILGGEGANRLFGVLRSDRALTYSASADLHTFKLGGDVVAQTNTRTPETVEALKLIVEEFGKLQRIPVSDEELLGAQNFIAGNFPLSIEAPSAIAEQVLSRLFYGQSLSEIETYLDRVSRVTPRDVQRVARELLHPDQLTIVLVGDAAGFTSQLAAAGFTTYERIPLADLDIDAPTLRRGAPASAAAPAPSTQLR